jgi:uncharacterized membrane protein
MNPFSAFLQPVRSPSPIAGLSDVVSAVKNRQLQQQELAQQALAQKDSSARDWQRIGLQEKAQNFNEQVQNRQWSEADKKQVESLLSEYQDAEDQGDPVRLDRAAQMLKRFGMDVSQAGTMDPRAEAFTGGKPPPLPGQLLPNVPAQSGKLDPRAEAFTGAKEGAPNPIGDAITQELASREALRAKSSEAEEPLPTQEEFEANLIKETENPPSRYEQVVNGRAGTTDEYKAKLGLGQPEDLGDVDSPEFQQAAEDEVIDLDADNPAPLVIGKQTETKQEAPQAAGQTAPALPGQLLPPVKGVRVSKNGEQLYQSTGPSNRWSPMVRGVFEPFLNQENPEIAQAAKRATDIATKLITVDGIAPKEAIKIGMDYLQNESTRLTNLERTKIGSKPRGGGGGAPGGINAKTRLPLSREMTATVRLFKSEDIQKGLQGYEGALGALNSSNTASQYDALNQLIAARSGKTVSDRERALYDRASGLWEQVKKKFNMAAGQPMPAEYRNQLRQLITEARNVLVEEREKRAKAAEAFHARKMRGAMTPDEVTEDSKGVGDAVRFGDSGGDPNADLDE